MVESTLEQLIYGTAIVSEVPSENLEVLALSEGFNADDAAALYQALALDPIAEGAGLNSQSVALINLDTPSKVVAHGRLLLARSHLQAATPAVPVYQFILVPSEALSRLGDIEALLKLFEKPIPNYAVSYAPLERLPLPMPTTWTLDKTVVLIKTLVDTKLGGEMRLLLGILGALLQKGLVIQNFAVNTQERLNLVRGLMSLLPALARPQLSFTSHTDVLSENLPKLVFSEAEGASAYAHLDWTNPELDDSYFEHPYVAHLADVWQENVIGFVEMIRRLDSYAAQYLLGKELNMGLEALVHRHQLEQKLEHGEMIPAAEATAILQEDKSLSHEMRLRYLQVLLQDFLNERDTKLAQFISQELSQNPKLEQDLGSFFVQALENHPDALYAFVRVRLNLKETPEAKWLKRLHDSAQKSLSIALESGDESTIESWLTLLSREPLRYELAPILHNGILAARETAVHSPKLAQSILTVAVKRQPETLPTLLEDLNLMSALPAEILAALQDCNPQAIEALSESSRELFLLAIQQAKHSQAPTINSSAIRALWQIHEQQQTNTLPPQFRPHLLILSLAEHPEVLQEGSLAVLLGLLLAHEGNNAFFYEIAPLLAGQGILANALVDALLQSGRDINDMIELLTKSLNDEWLTAQEVVDAYAFILAERQWDEDSRPLSEQLARAMTQYPETDTVTGVLWKLAELSGEYKNEQMLKVALRRMLEDIAVIPTETQVVESVLRLRKAVQWSNIGRTTMLRWWRNFAREQGTVQLQKMDKGLEAKRGVEELRAPIQTSLALRRILANRSLEEFAEAVATTYSILQALSEGFDASEKLVDSSTIRAEIEARSKELAPDERHVLATNLKELATVITTLSDNRSKPSIMRSDDSVERQLLTGEHSPQSALDVMRWLSGYLDGVQKGEGE